MWHLNVRLLHQQRLLRELQSPQLAESHQLAVRLHEYANEGVPSGVAADHLRLQGKARVQVPRNAVEIIRRMARLEYPFRNPLPVHGPVNTCAGAARLVSVI